MKSLPEKMETVADDVVDVANEVIEVLSSESEEREAAISSGSRKSKKKKKHHHRHHHEKRDKKRPKPADGGPIFLWAKKEETQILKVYCEDYDPRIKLVKTNGVWNSAPRSKVLGAVGQSRSSTCGGSRDDESQKDCSDGDGGVDDESLQTDELPEKKYQSEVEKHVKPEPQKLVDLNDNSVDFVDIVSSEDDEERTRLDIDKALEMIDKDPALMDELTIPPPNADPTVAIKLPEGTTIHKIKVENAAVPVSDGAVSESPPPPSPSLLSPKTPSVLRKFGELTITTHQQLQEEPLNLETVSKRSALEIRLQEPPLKKKRVKKQPEGPASEPPGPQDPPVATDDGEPRVKREWDPLSELKEVLSDPGLSVPDPLMVPRSRLAALVASPATEIPKLLRALSVLQPPAPDPERLAVSLKHLWTMLQQHPVGYLQNGNEQPSDVERAIWSSLPSKEMNGVNADLISAMLSIILPKSSSTAQPPPLPFPGYPQDVGQWPDVYFDGKMQESQYDPAPDYNQSDAGCCDASVLPLPSSLSPRKLQPPPPPPPVSAPPPPPPSSPQTLPQPQTLPPQQQQPNTLLMQQLQSQILPTPLPPQQPQLQLQPPQPPMLQKTPRNSSRRSRHRNMSHPDPAPQPSLSRSQPTPPTPPHHPVHRQSKQQRPCREPCCNPAIRTACNCGDICCPGYVTGGYNMYTAAAAAATLNGFNPYVVSPNNRNPPATSPATTYSGSGVPAHWFSADSASLAHGEGPSPVQIQPVNPSVTPCNRAQYNYQTGSGTQKQQQVATSSAEGVTAKTCFCGIQGCTVNRGCSSGVSGRISGGGVSGCSSDSGRSSAGISGRSSAGVSGRSSAGVSGRSSAGVSGRSSAGVSGRSSAGVSGRNSAGVSGCSSGSGVNEIGGNVVVYQCSTVQPLQPQMPTLPPPPATTPTSSRPVHRPTIKVKQHLIDPNANKKLINEDAMKYLAAGKKIDSSPIWHPLHGSEKRRSRWEWTKPPADSDAISPNIKPVNTRR